MKTVKRDSNLELMRIVSMIFIVLYHIILHGNFIDQSEGTSRFLLLLIESFILVHVNSYILLTGYFQSKIKFKMSKLISINNAGWFYRVLFLIIFSILGIVKFTHVDIFTNLMPFDYNNYWFLNSYLLLYLISPLLNKVIDTSSRRQLKGITIGCFIIVSIISTITLDTTVDTMNGRSIATFIMLYFIGAYLRQYPPETWNAFSKWTREKRQLIYIWLYIFIAILSFSCMIIADYLSPLGSLIDHFALIIKKLHVSYASPINVLEAIFYFLFFRTLIIKNNFINKLATACFGVYLISENYYVRLKIYKMLGITTIPVTRKVIILSIVAAILIFMVCSMIELLRKWIFKVIYNTELAQKNRKVCKDYLEKIGFSISW